MNIPAELRYVEYCGYPLPALIYEAQQGGANATYYVYWYFVNCVERGGDVDPAALNFVANELRMTLQEKVVVSDGVEVLKQTPVQMIHKNNARRIEDSLRVFEEVNAAFSECGKRYVSYEIAAIKLSKSVSAIKKLYKAEKVFQERIFKVQDLLDKCEEANRNYKSGKRWIAILNQIYENPATIR